MKHEMKRLSDVGEVVRSAMKREVGDGARALAPALPVSFAAPPERIGPEEPARVMLLSEMVFVSMMRRLGRLE